MVLVLRNYGLGTDEICSLTPGTDELPWPATCDGVAEGEAVSWKRSLQLGIHAAALSDNTQMKTARIPVPTQPLPSTPQQESRDYRDLVAM